MSRIPISTKTPVKSSRPGPSTGSMTANRSLHFPTMNRTISVANRHPYNPPTTPGRSRCPEVGVASELSIQDAGEKIDEFIEKYDIEFNLYNLMNNTTAEGILNLMGMILKKAYIKLNTNIPEIALKTINDSFKLFNLPYNFTTRHLLHPSKPEHQHHLMSAIAELCANRLDPLLQVRTDIKKEIVLLESIIPNTAAIKAINSMDLWRHARENQMNPQQVSSVLGNVLNREERQLDGELKELKQQKDECVKTERELKGRQARIDAEPLIYRDEEAYVRHMNDQETQLNQHKATFRLICNNYQSRATNKIRQHFRSTIEAIYNFSKDHSATEYTTILIKLMHTLNEDAISLDAVHGIARELRQLADIYEQENKVADEEQKILGQVLKAQTLENENDKMKHQQLMIKKAQLAKELEDPPEINHLQQLKLELQKKLTALRR